MRLDHIDYPGRSYDDKYYHGSFSSSLVGFCNQENPGLHCTGNILRQEEVPFCGELRDGISDNGINKHSLSAVGIYDLEQALFYTGERTLKDGRVLLHFYWRPDRHDEIQAANIEMIKRCEDKITSIENTRSDDKKEISLLIFNNDLKKYRKSFFINEQRKKQYLLLDHLSKKAILKRFPILYEFKNEDEVIIRGSASYREFVVPGSIESSRVNLYVPSNERAFTEDFLAKKGVEVAEVKSFQQLVDYFVNQLHLQISDRRELIEHLGKSGSNSPEYNANAVLYARRGYERTVNQLMAKNQADYKPDYIKNLLIEARWRLQKLF